MAAVTSRDHESSPETAMDYFQGVVTEYLRADRAMFVNPEFRIQLEPGDAPAKGQHWYCDVVAVNFREERVYLCEVTYSKTMQALLTRLRAWQTHWRALRAAIGRDCSVPASWKLRSCVFIPEELRNKLDKKLSAMFKDNQDTDSMPRPAVKILEKTVLPWTYRTGGNQSRLDECDLAALRDKK